MNNYKNPIVFAYVGGNATGVTTACNFFDKTSNLNKIFDAFAYVLQTEKKDSMIKEEILFNKNAHIKNEQKKLLSIFWKNLNVNDIYIHRIFSGSIKTFKFMKHENLEKIDNEETLKELLSLKKSLEKYSYNLQNYLNQILNSYNNGNNSELINRIFDIAFNAFCYLRDEDEVQDILKKSIRALFHGEKFNNDFLPIVEETDYLQLNNIIKKNNIEKIDIINYNCFNIFNTIVIKKYSKDYDGILNSIKSDLDKIIKKVDKVITENKKGMSINDLNKMYDYIEKHEINYPNLNLKRLFGQSKGNMIRLLYGNDYLAQDTIENIKKKGNKKIIFIETIKHMDEITYLKNNLVNTNLIAFFSSLQERKKRILKDALFEEDSLTFKRRKFDDLKLLDMKQIDYDIKRDEKDVYNFQIKSFGQQTEKCIAQADLILDTSSSKAILGKDIYNFDLTSFFNKLIKYFFIASIPGYETPTNDEIFMAHAYNISLNSGCLNRKVGAVIVNSKKNILSVGWNNPPNGIENCNEIGRGCEKKNQKNEIQAICRSNLDRNNCEDCISDLLKDDKECPIEKVNNQIKFSNYCRTIHAEEKALLDFSQLNVNTKDCIF